MTVAAATAIYSAVATGMLALTGIVFSLVFVMVQFSSATYSPRLVRFLSTDPILFHALGVFTATFVYAIAALAWADRLGSTRAPFFSSFLVLGLLVASVGMLVALINRLARLHISNVLSFTGDFGRRTIDELYTVGQAFSQAQCLPSTDVAIHDRVTQTLHYSGPPRAIQSLDVPALLSLAEEADGVIEMVSAVGDTIVESTLVLRVYDAREPVCESALRAAILTGAERTFDQDPKYAIRLLVDIAIRALSPAVNDPSTAVQALDQIEDLLVRLGRRHLEVGQIYGRDGHLRLVLAIPEWDDFLNLALDEIRYYGSGSIQVMRRMRALLTDLLEAVPENRREAVRAQQKRLASTVRRSFSNAEDHVEASVEDREGLGAPRHRNGEQTPISNTQPIGPPS
jgi:uncharacterized membrane protein